MQTRGVADILNPFVPTKLFVIQVSRYLLKPWKRINFPLTDYLAQVHPSTLELSFSITVHPHQNTLKFRWPSEKIQWLFLLKISGEKFCLWLLISVSSLTFLLVLYLVDVRYLFVWSIFRGTFKNFSVFEECTADDECRRDSEGSNHENSSHLVMKSGTNWIRNFRWSKK